VTIHPVLLGVRIDPPSGRRYPFQDILMTRRIPAVMLLLVAAATARAADAPPYAVKVADSTAPPNEVQEPIRKLLDERCIQLVTAKGDLVLELWLRKEVPAKATETQIKNGLTYREVPESTVVGAVRFARDYTDYRKQKIKAGVYTLRLATQPMDGDHMGTAPYNQFCLLSPAADDRTPATMAAKSLHELSAKSTEGHPGVMLLFPGKGAEATPKLVSKGSGHWAVLFLLDVKAGEQKAQLPMALNLIGVSAAA
jgi:hypothetical protein